MGQTAQGRPGEGSEAASSANCFRVGDLIVDLAHERVTRAGSELDLGKLTFDLLAVLVRAAPELVSTEALMERVWPGLVVGTETVSQRVKRLREALGDDPKIPRYIEGVRGRGYRVIAPVTPHTGGDEPASAAPGGRPRRRWPAVLLVLLGALGIGAAAIAWRMLHAPEPMPQTRSFDSIAVLPFVNLTGDVSKDYLSDGMAEELIDHLAQIPGLNVPARSSSFAYKGRTADVRRIAADLNVATVLEGSVRSGAERVRVTAELIDARSGYHLWSQSYDRPFADIFALEDEISGAIVQALRGKLPATAHAAPTTDPEAYRLYLQARGLAETSSEESAHLALERLDAALARDPRFARALAFRAELRMTFLIMGYALPNAMEDAERDAGEALGIEPDSADANWALAVNDAFRGNWLESERRFRRALAVNRGDAYVRGDYIDVLLTSVGSTRAAYARAVEAYQLAPADPFTVENVAFMNSFLGHDAEAVRFADLAVALGIPDAAPLPEVRANAATRAGRYVQAGEYLLKSMPASLQQAGGASAIRDAYAALATPARLPAALRSLRTFARSLTAPEADPIVMKDVVAAFVMLGDLDDAFELLNRSLDGFARSGTVGSAWGILWLPEMKTMRRDPRFQALAGRLKLLDYWRAVGPPDGCTLQGERLACT